MFMLFYLRLYGYCWGKNMVIEVCSMVWVFYDWKGGRDFGLELKLGIVFKVFFL